MIPKLNGGAMSLDNQNVLLLNIFDCGIRLSLHYILLYFILDIVHYMYNHVDDYRFSVRTNGPGVCQI